MRRLSLLCLALPSLLLLLPGCGATASATAPATPPRALFVGDSLTAGAYASEQAHSYAARVTAALGTPALDTEGHYGWTTSATLDALRSTHPAPPGATLVVVELGTNDVGAHTPLATFRAHYTALVTTLQHAEPHAARWVCLGTWRDDTDAHDPLDGAPYNAVIQAVCPGTYVPLGDLYATGTNHGPAGRTTWMGTGDWFHPNDAAHAAIAERVIAALDA